MFDVSAQPLWDCSLQTWSVDFGNTLVWHGFTQEARGRHFPQIQMSSFELIIRCDLKKFHKCSCVPSLPLSTSSFLQERKILPLQRLKYLTTYTIRDKCNFYPWSMLIVSVCDLLFINSSSVWISYPRGSYSWRGQACGQGECWSRHRWPVSGAEPGTGPAPGSEGMKAWLGTRIKSLHPSNIPPRGLLLSHLPWTYHRGPSASGMKKADIVYIDPKILVVA